MKTLPLALPVFRVPAVSSLARVAARKQVQKSAVCNWSTTRTTRNGWGAVRQPSNELHKVASIGESPATDYVIGWTLPGAK